MAKKVIIDCDPGIDDAVALCMALFDPRLEVVAITATAGNVSAQQATRNIQSILDRLDPPRFPRLGASSPLESAPVVERWRLHGKDGLGNAGFGTADLHHPRPAEKVICDAIREAPDQITIIALGPLTNIARAIQRDREMPSAVGQLVMTGGSVGGVGDVTAAAEFNMFYDPLSAQAVFHSPMTKTLIPLDATSTVPFSLDFVDALPNDTSRAGEFVRQIVPFAFRAYRQELGTEVVPLPGVVALLYTLHPELFETQEMAGDVETGGVLATGATIFDRRQSGRATANMDVALGVDAAAVRDAALRALATAAEATA